MANLSVDKIKQDYLSFSGSIDKKTFLISFLILLGAYIVALILIGILGSIIGSLASILALVVYVVFTVAYFSITIRRLHDLKLSGWLSLLMLIPLINLAFLIYLCIADSKI